jgi:Tol biopolymer transport system component
MPDNPMPGYDRPRELFLASGRHVLQLTNFNRVDENLSAVVSRRSNRVFFSASADPFGCNPRNHCQVFSIDTLGANLRQLTRFDKDMPEHGCFSDVAPDCRGRVIAEDRATGSILIDSSCHPLGTSPTANQVYVMRPDGSGLRQITRARGVVADTPDVIEVELAGPIAYQ